jgi:hypothetical protein
MLALTVSAAMLLVSGLSGSAPLRPIYPLAALAGFCLYCWRRERVHGAAWFFPAALWLVAAWWEFAAVALMPGIALLDFSRLAIEDPAAEIARARTSLKLLDIEVLSEKIGQKIQQFALGLRLQVDDIAGNEYLGRVIGSRSDVNLDAHLNRGGVLVVNTAMGHLGKLGDTFGQFLIMHFQNAVFRRKGNEFTRARHMLIMDEAHRYINPDFERLLAMGRGFRCECVLALQNTAQLSLDEKRSFRESVLNLCRNKIVFGGMDYNEARFFAGEFGETKTKTMQKQYAANLLYRQPWKDLRYRETDNVFEQRFDYTRLIEMPAFHVVYRIVKDGRALPPGIGVTRLSEWDRFLKKDSGAPQGGLLVKNEEALPVVPSGSVNASTDVRL